MGSPFTEAKAVKWTRTKEASIPRKSWVLDFAKVVKGTILNIYAGLSQDQSMLSVHYV